MVKRLQSSKQIARELGISRYTVDQRLMLACRKLGVSSRAEAALLLGAHEQREGNAAVTAGPAMPQLVAAERNAEPHVDRPPAQILMKTSQTEPTAPGTESRLSLPFPTAGELENRLTIAQRLGWALFLAAASILAFGILIGALAALGRLL